MMIFHYQPHAAMHLPYWTIYSLPRNVMIVLHAGQAWPAGIDRSNAITVWSGHASDLNTALQAAL